MELDKKTVLDREKEVSKNNIEQKKPSLSIFEAIEQRKKEDLQEQKKFQNALSSEYDYKQKLTQNAEQIRQENTQKNEQIVEKQTSSTITSPNYDTITASNTGIDFKVKDKKKKKFRLKLVIAVYAIIFAMCAGWVTYSAIEISNTNYQIVQYIVKIDQLDDAYNVQQGEENLISTVVPIETRELAEPTKVQPQTNWFDKICNFFSHLFGG